MRGTRGEVVRGGVLGGRFSHSLPGGLGFILLMLGSSMRRLQTKSRSWESRVNVWMEGRGNTLLGLSTARLANEYLDSSAWHAGLFVIAVAGDQDELAVGT